MHNCANNVILKAMNETHAHLETVGHLLMGHYELDFVISIDENSISLYDTREDEIFIKEYKNGAEVMETVALLMASETMRNEFKTVSQICVN